MSVLLFIVAYFLWGSLIANLYTVFDSRGDDQHIKMEVKRLGVRLIMFATLSYIAQAYNTNAVYWAGATVVVGYLIGYYSVRLAVKFGIVTQASSE